MSEMVKELNSGEFENKIKKGITLVDFWAPWCGPCKVQGGILEEVSQSLGSQADVAKVNVDEIKNIAAKYNVQGIPTLILFQDGSEIKRFIGLQKKDTLIEEINELVKQKN